MSMLSLPILAIPQVGNPWYNQKMAERNNGPCTPEKCDVCGAEDAFIRLGPSLSCGVDKVTGERCSFAEFHAECDECHARYSAIVPDWPGIPLKWERSHP